MDRRRFLKTAGAVAAATVAPEAIALAQSAYPSRPISYIVPYPPGGSSDISARLIAINLAKALNGSVVVVNKSGSAIVGAADVANGEPDGYTLGHLASGFYSITPHLEKLPYDPFKNFQPIANLMATYTGMVANKAFPPNTVQELVAYARAHPGEVTFASSGVGGYSHLLGEALKIAADIDMLHVPYSGSAPAMNDLRAGRVNILFDSAPVERVKSGQVKGLAAMSPKRIAQLPDMPSIFEVYPKFLVGDSGWGMFAPAGTPGAIVVKLSAALAQIAKDPDYIAKVDSYGFGNTYRDTAAFSQQMHDEYDQLGEVIQRASIKIEN